MSANQRNNGIDTLARPLQVETAIGLPASLDGRFSGNLWFFASSLQKSTRCGNLLRPGARENLLRDCSRAGNAAFGPRSELKPH